MRRSELDAFTARRFRSGRACLDFVHTGGVGRWTAAELIHDRRDAVKWVELILDLDPATLRADSVDVGRVKALREAIWNSTQRLFAGRSLARADVVVLNSCAAPAPLPVAIAVNGKLRRPLPCAMEQALSTVARDAIDLFAGDLRARLRTCAAADCELLFFDTSRAGNRRWCSMQRCGARTKMRTHRQRSASTPGGLRP